MGKNMIKLLMVMSVFVFVSSCGRNPLSDLSQAQTSDAALYEDILKKLDSQSYAAAVTYIQAQSATFQAQDKTLEYLGEAYLGLCGFNFLDFASNYGNVSGSQMLKKFTYAFNRVTVDPTYCDSAYNTLKNLSESNANKHMLLLATGMSRLGTYLKTKLDLDGNGVIDRTLDANYCTSGGAAPLTDAHAKKAFAGLGLILQNFVGIAGDLLGDSASASISTFLSTCEAALGAGNCTITDEANVTDPMVTSFRLLLDTSSDGFGSCTLPACCL